MVRLATSVLAFALVLAAAPAQAAKIGVVDVQRVMKAVPTWTKTVSALKKEWETKEAKLKGDQAALRKQKEQLDAKKVVADPKKIAAEERALIEAAQKLADNFMRQQAIINQQEVQLKEQLLKRLEPIVYKLALDADLSFVFEAGPANNPNVLYNNAKVDLTKKVIAMYKQQYKDAAFEVAEPKLPPQPRR